MSSIHQSPSRPLRFAAAFGLLLLASCDGGMTGGPSSESLEGRKGIAPASAIPDAQIFAGQTIYVPAYSSILTTDAATRYNLAVTLSVRNTDRDRPIVLTSVRYVDHDGVVVREDLTKPIRLAPLAAAEFFVTESDSSGGVSASFLVEWAAEKAVTDPLVEAVMISTASGQGLSFTSRGRVIAERRSADQGPETPSAGQ